MIPNSFYEILSNINVILYFHYHINWKTIVKIIFNIREIELIRLCPKKKALKYIENHLHKRSFHESRLTFLARTRIDINRNFNFLGKNVRQRSANVSYTRVYIHVITNFQRKFGGYGPFISIVKTRCCR